MGHREVAGEGVSHSWKLPAWNLGRMSGPGGAAESRSRARRLGVHTDVRSFRPPLRWTPSPLLSTLADADCPALVRTGKGIMPHHAQG